MFLFFLNGNQFSCKDKDTFRLDSGDLLEILNVQPNVSSTVFPPVEFDSGELSF